MFLAAPALSLILLTMPPRWMDRQVVVFRHHPAQIDTKERMAACTRDEKTIFAALKEAEFGYTYGGGLGSGYELKVRIRDLEEWQKLVAKLQKCKSLDYYTDWQTDPKGFGLLLNRYPDATAPPTAPAPREKPKEIAPKRA